MRREDFGYENLMEALNHMQGTFLVCDRERNIVYYNDEVCEKLEISEEKLRNLTLYDLAMQRYITNSASQAAFDTKKLSIKYVEGRMDIPLLTVSTPVLDEQGEVEYVVAFSVDEQLTEVISQEMIRSRLESMQLLDFLSNKISDHATVIAESPAMRNILALLSRIARVDSTILLTGETGVGKEVLAKYIHNSSDRSGRVFIPINCAAIPESLMESEFFGYTHGAFTGARKEGKLGVFELADGGTLFLDEVGELPLPIQAKFLRVIETGEVVRLGTETGKKVNFRLIAATNRNLVVMCEQGLFRNDLYYRLNILNVEIPPLRERREDIIPLAKFFLNGLNKKYGFTKILSYRTIQRLKRYPWPGNVRELRNIIERLVMTAQTDILELDQPLDWAGRELSIVPPIHMQEPGRPGDEATQTIPLHEAVAAYEKRVILDTLDACGGNVAKAADALKIHKTGLYRKLERYKNGF